MGVKIIVGQIIHCVAPYSVNVVDDGFIIIDGRGKILAVGNEPDLEATKKQLGVTTEDTLLLTKTQLLLPGFVDTHIHAPQYPNAGLGYDKPLLQWLEHYTYNLEKKYRDKELCDRVFNAVVRKTLDHGTTTACYFGSLFHDSTLVLAKAVSELGQRAFVGKINMIKLAPEDYVETAEASIENTLKFITDVKSLGNSMVQPIITPRFALSVDLEHMQKLGEIAKEHDLHIQTHISENRDEVEMVDQLYKDTYTNVYYKANLLTPKTVLAHGIYLNDDEMELLRKTQTSIAHCPESNVNLGSGVCDVIKLKEHGVTVGLGTGLNMPGKSLSTRAQNMVGHLIEYFSAEKENGGPLLSLNAIEQRVAEALGINLPTVSKIKTKKERLGVLASPTKRGRSRKSPKTKDLDESIKMEIRNTLYDMCKDNVAGGASPSIITAMRSAINASTHLSYTKENYKPLNYEDVFYLATLGGAKALALDDKIGNFQVEKAFDAIIVDLDVENSSVDYISDCNPSELLQKLIFVGDDRNVIKVYVNGEIVKNKDK